MKKPFRGIWFRYTKQKRGGLCLSILPGVCMAVFLLRALDSAIRPQLVALAETQIRNHLDHIANQAVVRAMNEQSLSYDDLVILQSESGDGITMLSTDTIQLNLLRSAVMEDIISGIESLDNRSLGVPLGAVTGIDILSAVGPEVPVRVLSVAATEGTYRNEFVGAGINQTLHRLLLDITVTAKLLLPGGIVQIQLSTPVCISETIIVGQVPQTYLTINQ